MRTRTVGLVVFGVCVLVTLAAVGLARVRDPESDGAVGWLGASGRPMVALVKLDGGITDAMVEPRRRGRENVLAQLRRIERDDDTKAVVLRVNSPGGSAGASQTIYEQIRRMRERGKTVVVYFADIAASGGYYVGAAGDRIVSQPSAITGSIGVIMTSLDVRGLYDKIGIQSRVIKTGTYKDILSATRDITPEERAILEKLLGDMLDQFVAVVAQGRNLPEEDVRAIADGRIISGREALRLRLVDELGDERRAVRLAAELSGQQGEPRVVYYEQPQPGGWLRLLSSALSLGEWPEALLPAPGVSIRYEWRAS